MQDIEFFDSIDGVRILLGGCPVWFNPATAFSDISSFLFGVTIVDSIYLSRSALANQPRFMKILPRSKLFILSNYFDFRSG